MAKTNYQSPGHYTAKDRDTIPPEDFAGPDQSYPIVTQQDVHDAARLVGHAANPAAVKARIKAIAKRKGYTLPDAWQDDGNADRARQPASVYALRSDEALTRCALPSTIRVIDQDRREIEVTATSEALDSFGTIFGYDASKQAFQRWLGNVREMHGNLAVGRRVGVIYDDGAKKIQCRLRISEGAEPTWKKILDGTLQGVSIGASNVQWEERRAAQAGGRPVRYATKYDLVELSLVDNPSNPDALGITVIRSAQPDTSLLATLETEDRMSIPIPTDAQAGETSGTIPDPLAVAAALDPTSPLAQARAREAEARRVKAAGIEAAKNVAPQQPGEDYATYIARVQTARGLAELRAAQASTTRDGAGGPTGGIMTATGLQGHEMDGEKKKPDEDEDETARVRTAEEKRTSPVKTVQPRHVGQRVLVNTEDVEAKDFGVPDEAPRSPTSDDHTLSSSDYPVGKGKPGGHTKRPDMAPTGEPYDEDGDHDGDADAQPDEESAAQDTGATPIAKGRKTPHERAKKASPPPPPDEDEDEENDGDADDEERLATASATRKGARVSADSRDALHGVRDDQLSALQKTCTHCGCPACQGVLMILGSGDDSDVSEGDVEDAEAPENPEAARVILAVLTRQMQQLEDKLTRQFQASVTRMTHSVTNRLADIETVVADMGEHAQAETARLMTAEVNRLADQQTQVLQRVEAIASLGEGLEARVERMEMQPNLAGGPMGIATKRMVTDLASRAQQPQTNLDDLVQRVNRAGVADAGIRNDLFAALLQQQQADAGQPMGPMPIPGTPRTR